MAAATFLAPLPGHAEASAADTTPSSAKTTRTLVSFHSPALGREVQYFALLPDPQERGRRYPVLYLLHGATGNYREWTERTSLTQVLHGMPLIVITPDGGTYGWYLDSPLRLESRYETFVTKDLIADVDARFPTIAAREGRGIAGLSMGGHGALSLASKHPNLFGSASSMSGILHLQNHPTNWELNTLLGGLPEAAQEWNKHSVLSRAECFTTAGVALLFDTGTSDTLSVDDCRELRVRLQKLGVTHEYREFPGGHTWEYWRDRLPEHLDFHRKAFRTEGANR